MSKSVTRKQKRLFPILIILALYAGVSVLLGFPLFFGKMIARDMAKDYGKVVYPQATLGETVFNPVSSSFETALNLGKDTIGIRTYPNRDTVGDSYREERFLQEKGIAEVISKLHRTYVQGRYYRFVECSVSWACDDPTTPITNLRFDYGDYDHLLLPDEGEIKEILAPIALDCITQVEALYPLNSACLFYSHPDFNPGKDFMMWKIMKIPLDNNIPRTKELLDHAEFAVN